MIQTPLEMALVLLVFLMGWVVGWAQTREPLVRKVKNLESVLERDSAQRMDRILALEQELRETQRKSLDYQMELAKAQDQLMWRLQ